MKPFTGIFKKLADKREFNAIKTQMLTKYAGQSCATTKIKACNNLLELARLGYKNLCTANGIFETVIAYIKANGTDDERNYYTAIDTFAEGDKVKVVKKVTEGLWNNSWVLDMDGFIGKEGKVLSISYATGIKVSVGSYNYSFLPESLQKI